MGEEEATFEESGWRDSGRKKGEEEKGEERERCGGEGKGQARFRCRPRRDPLLVSPSVNASPRSSIMNSIGIKSIMDARRVQRDEESWRRER